MPAVAEDVRAIFGQRVRELRVARGWSQEALAECAGLHWTYIGGIERGERNPSLINLARLARAFSLSLRDLFDHVDTSRRSTRGETRLP